MRHVHVHTHNVQLFRDREWHAFANELTERRTLFWFLVFFFQNEHQVSKISASNVN